MEDHYDDCGDALSSLHDVPEEAAVVWECGYDEASLIYILDDHGVQCGLCDNDEECPLHMRCPFTVVSYPTGETDEERWQIIQEKFGHLLSFPQRPIPEGKTEDSPHEPDHPERCPVCRSLHMTVPWRIAGFRGRQA